MNNFTKVIITLGIILLISSCTSSTTENQIDNPTPPQLAATYDLEFTFPDSTELLAYDSELIDYNGTMVPAYSLNQFVDQDTVDNYVDEDSLDCRGLFAIQIVSNDDDGNWSPRLNGYYDLSWQNFITGYLLPNEKGRTYFADDNIPSGYNVRWAGYLRLYRKIDVILDGNITIFESGAFTTEEITYTKNGETYTANAVELENFISDYVTLEPESYQFLFTAGDGWINDDSNNIFDWNTIENSFWLPEHNKAIFLDTDHDTIFKSVKVLEKIELVEISK
ncbi:MAG: hypothetical protein K9N07_02220 [Candidatus Cloacimonetes bacterium]|nr:hypothetical protein [Candidatus Cloacimonadota bacterium]